MSSVCRNKKEQGRAVSKKPFILVVYRGGTYATVQMHVHLLTRGITHVKVYTAVSIDTNTLELPTRYNSTTIMRLIPKYYITILL